jgi:hypothetical protein
MVASLCADPGRIRGEAEHEHRDEELNRNQIETKPRDER